MKKRSNKGIALASTLIMMTIVLMMSILMMTVTLYATQVTGVHRQTVEDRVVLDEIGSRFLNNKEDPAAFLRYYVDHSDSGLSYYNTLGDPTDEPQTVVKGTYKGIKLILNVNESTSNLTLTVSSLNNSKQLMKIACDKITNARTGAVTVTLKSWEYR